MRQLEVREITGYDEDLLAQIRYYPVPFRSSALLRRVVLRFENHSIVANTKIDKTKILQTMSQGDRIALLLNIRKMVFGDRISCSIACSKCKEMMSFDLSISELLQSSKVDPKKEYPLQTEGFSLKVRPITGADLELLFVNRDDHNNNGNNKDNNTSKNDKTDSPYDNNNSNNKKENSVNVTNMAERLVRSCITFSDPPLPQLLTSNLIEAVSSKLGEIEPQANMVLELRCVTCQHQFKTHFDAEKFILSEIDMRSRQLYQEVHWIAFHYHWQEDFILSLPVGKRKRYLDLINKTLAGESL